MVDDRTGYNLNLASKPFVNMALPITLATVFALIVVIIGGMGSVTGSFVGAIIVGLSFNYVAFLVPKMALGVNFMIMAVILSIRPTGLFGKE